MLFAAVKRESVQLLPPALNLLSVALRLDWKVLDESLFTQGRTNPTKHVALGEARLRSIPKLWFVNSIKSCAAMAL